MSAKMALKEGELSKFNVLSEEFCHYRVKVF